jgi:hypothetical protein
VEEDSDGLRLPVVISKKDADRADETPIVETYHSITVEGEAGECLGGGGPLNGTFGVSGSRQAKPGNRLVEMPFQPQEDFTFEGQGNMAPYRSKETIIELGQKELGAFWEGVISGANE